MPIDLSKLKKKKKTKVSTTKKPLQIKYIKDGEDNYTVVVNGRKIGEVKRDIRLNWMMEPSFPPLIEDDPEVKAKYTGPIEASREMVKLWERYRNTTRARMGPPDWMDNIFEDVSI